MNQSSFGNFINNNSIIVDTDTSATGFIPNFGNISAYDNTTTYGDNKARVRIGNTIVYYSDDEIVYNYINALKLENMTPLIVLATGNNITFTGQGFFNSTALNCKFGNYLAAAVYYINTTKIICTTPVITDLL